MIEAKELQDHKANVAEKGMRHDKVSAKSELLKRLDLETPKARLKTSLDRFGFLFCHYGEQGFWWELMVLTRKLAFAVIVNLPRAPEQQTMLGILCLLPYVLLVYRYKPYVSSYLDTMDLVGTTLAAGLALTGLVLFGGYETHLTPFEASAIQIVLIMATMAFLVVNVVYDSIPKFQLVVRLERQRWRLRRLVEARGSTFEIDATATMSPVATDPCASSFSSSPSFLTATASRKWKRRRAPPKRRSSLQSMLGTLGVVAKPNVLVFPVLKDEATADARADLLLVGDKSPRLKRDNSISRLLLGALGQLQSPRAVAPSSAEGSVRTVHVSPRKREPPPKRGSSLANLLHGRTSSSSTMPIPGRELRTLDDMLALLRAAVTLMVSPKRHRLMDEFRQDLQDTSYKGMCRSEAVSFRTI